MHQSGFHIDERLFVPDANMPHIPTTSILAVTPLPVTNCLCCRYQVTDLDSLQTLMPHDRQMALGLQAAEQEGLLSACLAWITHVELEEGGYTQMNRFTASHWWGLDCRKLAWEPQTIQEWDQYPDIFVQVQSTERASMSFNSVMCCSAKAFAKHFHSHFSVLHIGLLHNCACWRQNAVAFHDACRSV